LDQVPQGIVDLLGWVVDSLRKDRCQSLNSWANTTDVGQGIARNLSPHILFLDLVVLLLVRTGRGSSNGWREESEDQKGRKVLPRRRHGCALPLLVLLLWLVVSGWSVSVDLTKSSYMSCASWFESLEVSLFGMQDRHVHSCVVAPRTRTFDMARAHTLSRPRIPRITYTDFLGC
jgi:hypothetical protein